MKPENYLWLFKKLKVFIQGRFCEAIAEENRVQSAELSKRIALACNLVIARLENPNCEPKELTECRNSVVAIATDLARFLKLLSDTTEGQKLKQRIGEYSAACDDLLSEIGEELARGPK